MFSLKFKVHPQILKFIREINHDYNFFATMVHFIIKFAGKICQECNDIYFHYNMYKCLLTDLLYHICKLWANKDIAILKDEDKKEKDK